MPRASVTLPPDVYKTLEQIAREKKVSLAWVICDAAKKYIAEKWPLFELSERGVTVWTAFPLPRGRRSWPRSVRRTRARRCSSAVLFTRRAIDTDFTSGICPAAPTLSFGGAEKLFLFTAASGTGTRVAPSHGCRNHASTSGSRNFRPTNEGTRAISGNSCGRVGRC